MALSQPTPSAIEDCVPGLIEAAECLRRFEHNVAGVEQNCLAELRALNREITGARRLMKHGADFYQGWARVLGAASGGYTPAGEATPITSASKILIRG